MTRFNCSACGGPNEIEAGAIRMTCTYCGANLTIPEHLRTSVKPTVEKISSKAKPVFGPEIDAADLIRKAQPAAIQAWNMYAVWTRLRWLIPTCFTFLVAGFFLCAALGAAPFIMKLFR